MPALTGQIVNQGVVLVYSEHVKLENNDTTGQQVYQVPAVFPAGNIGNTSNPRNIVTQSYLYGIILIPGGVLGTNVDPHTLTYKEVSTKFGIQP